MRRHEPFTPMDYKNQALMNDLNEFCIALKVWLYPDQFGDKLADLQRRYPKPDLPDIDNLQAELNLVLRKDSEPFIKY